MQYTNVKLPMDTLYLMKDEDIRTVISRLAGSEYEFNPSCCEANTGYSGIGPWGEGDIDIYKNGIRYVLSYDFIDLGNGTGRVFRSTVYWPGMEISV